MANKYSTIKTNAALALETSAQAGGEKITLTHMAIGDGGGNAVMPDPSQTGLVREQVRVSLNAIAVNPDTSNQFTAEAIIPASSGGFTMREAGLYTADGVLFAVANLPQVYKPSSSEGSFGQVVVTMTFQAANSDEVNLSVDENVSVATRLWVENYVIPEHVFKGGTTGQFLAKSANDDGAWKWVDPSASVQVLVDTIEEDQTLASGQTIITLSKVTANGLGVFINGVRLRDDEWSKIDDTHISLHSARNDGDRITLLQNEQTGYSDVLRADRNLSDVDDADASLANLSGLSTKGGRVEGLFAVDSGVVYANRAAGNDRGVMMQTNGLNRFSIVAANDEEVGDNAGSSFRINRYDDAGNWVDIPLYISRQTGDVSLGNTLSVGRGIHAQGAVQADSGLLVANGNSSGNYAVFGSMPSGDYAAVRINPPATYNVNLFEVGKGGDLSFCVQADSGSIFNGYATFKQATYFNGAARFDDNISRTLGVSDYPGNTGNSIPNTAWIDKYYAPSEWVRSTFGTQSWIGSTFATQSALSNETSRAQGAETSLNNGKADKNAPSFTGGVDITGSDGSGKYFRIGGPLPSGAYAAFQIGLPSSYGVNPIQVNKGGTQVFAIGTDNGLYCAGGGTFGGGLSAAGDVRVGAGKWLYTDTIVSRSVGSVGVSSPLNLNEESWLNKTPSDQPGSTGSHIANTGWVDSWYAPRSALASEVSRAQGAESNLQGQINSVSAS
uniref:phage tail protein n=1 Tax=Gluconobacter thailandicus TaxID=257438 RepID=UPI000A85364E